MDSQVKILTERAETELVLAEKIRIISEDKEIKHLLKIADEMTFYSAVISHSYYSIFYASKAYLLNKGIKINAPAEHLQAYEEFKKFVDNKEIDYELLRIYQDALIKAEVLLKIFKNEKEKRTNFTYNTISQANKAPAEESISNSKIFIRNIIKIIRNNDEKG